MMSDDEVVTLGQVAAIGEDEVLDGVVGPAGPRQEVIDVTPAGQRVIAVEIAAVLEFAQSRHERQRKRDTVAAEEVRLQGLVLEPDPGPAGDVPTPVQLDQWSKHRSEDNEPVGDA